MAAVGPGRFDGDRARKNAPLVTRFRRFGRYRLRGRCRVRLAPQQFERPLLQRRQRAQLRHTVLRSRLQPQLQRRERRPGEVATVSWTLRGAVGEVATVSWILRGAVGAVALERVAP